MTVNLMLMDSSAIIVVVIVAIWLVAVRAGLCFFPCYFLRSEAGRARTIILSIFTIAVVGFCGALLYRHYWFEWLQYLMVSELFSDINQYYPTLYIGKEWASPLIAAATLTLWWFIYKWLAGTVEYVNDYNEAECERVNEANASKPREFEETTYQTYDVETGEVLSEHRTIREVTRYDTPLFAGPAVCICLFIMLTACPFLTLAMVAVNMFINIIISCKEAKK